VPLPPADEGSHRPPWTGLNGCEQIGMVDVELLQRVRGRRNRSPPAVCCTSSAAIAGSRSYDCPPNDTARDFWPGEANSYKAAPNALMKGAKRSGRPPDGLKPEGHCCARGASGHAAAPPPRPEQRNETRGVYSMTSSARIRKRRRYSQTRVLAAFELMVNLKRSALLMTGSVGPVCQREEFAR